MPVIMSSRPGFVTAISDPVEQASFQPMVAVEGNALSFQQSKSLITSVMISAQTNQQFLHTLGDTIYIYVFGDRIGEMVLSGVAAAGDCDGGDASHGVEKLRDYFNANKLSKRQTPMNLVIGRNTRLQAYLGDFQASTADPKSMIMQYRMGFFVLPEK